MPGDTVLAFVEMDWEASSTCLDWVEGVPVTNGKMLAAK